MASASHRSLDELDSRLRALKREHGHVLNLDALRRHLSAGSREEARPRKHPRQPPPRPH